MFWKKSSPAYTAARSSDSDSDDAESELLRHEKFQQRGERNSKPLWRRSFWLIFFTSLNLILFSFSLWCLYRLMRLENNLDNGLIRKTSMYSPALDEIAIKYETVQFKGSLFTEKANASIFRQPPSPEVDAAWERISDVGPFAVNAETVRRIGKDPKEAVKMPKSWGYGDDAYLAQIDGFHQVHCLNVLRRNLWINHAYYADKPYKRHEHGHGVTFNEAHIVHCLYTILQTLKCAANSDVILYNWAKGQTHPYPDFDVNHKCRNFDQLWEWFDSRKMDVLGKPGLTREEVLVEGQTIIEKPAPEEGVELVE